MKDKWWKMKDEWLMMKDEGWKMKNEGWKFWGIVGFDLWLTDERTFAIVESLSRLKTKIQLEYPPMLFLDLCNIVKCSQFWGFYSIFCTVVPIFVCWEFSLVLYLRVSTFFHCYISKIYSNPLVKNEGSNKRQKMKYVILEWSQSN